MAHAQKPDLVFRRNGRVHLYRQGCQFSRLLAVEVCASAVVMLDRLFSDTVQDCWLPTPFASFPFTSPPVLHRVPPDSISTLPTYQSTLHHIPEDLDIYQHNCEKLKCYIHANTHMYMLIHIQRHNYQDLKLVPLRLC